MTSSASLPEHDWNVATAASNYFRYRPAYASLAAAWLSDFYRSATGRERAQAVIEAGCGPGLLSVPIADFSDRVLAVDIASEMLAEACRVSARPNIEYLHGDARKLSDVHAAVGAPPADIVVTGMAAQYVEFDCDAFYSGARSVLRPGGVIGHFGCYYAGFDCPGMENAIFDFFMRAFRRDRLMHYLKMKDRYKTLYFPFPESQYRIKEEIVDMTRDDVRNFLISAAPVFEDGDRLIDEFMAKDLPSGDHFRMKMWVFGRMAQIP